MSIMNTLICGICQGSVKCMLLVRTVTPIVVYLPKRSGFKSFVRTTYLGITNFHMTFSATFCSKKVKALHLQLSDCLVFLKYVNYLRCLTFFSSSTWIVHFMFRCSVHIRSCFFHIAKMLCCSVFLRSVVLSIFSYTFVVFLCITLHFQLYVNFFFHL